MFRPAILMRNESVDIVPSSYIVGSGSDELGIEDESSPELEERLRRRMESRRKYVLVIGILDVFLGIGQVIYHSNRAIYFFHNPHQHLGKYEHLSWASYIIWGLTFLISALQISMAFFLISATYSKTPADSDDESRTRLRRVSRWLLTSQFLLTVLIIKLIVFTASSQLEFDLGVFFVLLEDPTSLWFVLLFYSLQILFRGLAIYLVKRYL